MSENDEMLQRVRRIETRITQIAVALDVPTKAQKPSFDPGNLSGPATVQVPSPHSSMKEVADSIPQGFVGRVDVLIGDKRIATLDCSG